VQRDSLLVQGFSIHISRIRRAWYPFDTHEKQWAAKAMGLNMEATNRREVMALMGAAALAGGELTLGFAADAQEKLQRLLK